MTGKVLTFRLYLAPGSHMALRFLLTVLCSSCVRGPDFGGGVRIFSAGLFTGSGTAPARAVLLN